MQCQEYEYKGAKVKVIRPDLADDERKRRMADIKLNAERLLKGRQKNEFSTHNTNNN